jgi:hypothetical protein
MKHQIKIQTLALIPLFFASSAGRAQIVGATIGGQATDTTDAAFGGARNQSLQSCPRQACCGITADSEKLCSPGDEQGHHSLAVALTLRKGHSDAPFLIRDRSRD